MVRPRPSRDRFLLRFQDPVRADRPLPSARCARRPSREDTEPADRFCLQRGSAFPPFSISVLHFRKPEPRSAIDVEPRRFPPRPTFEIPLHRLRDAFSEGLAGLPSKFVPRLRCIDRVAQIVSGPIVYKRDERSPRCRPWHYLVENVANEFDDIEVTSLAVAAEIVLLSRPSQRQQTYETLCMVVDIQPITYVGTVAVHRQRFTLDRVQDDQWNEFLRKLVRTVIIRTIRDDDW